MPGAIVVGAGIAGLTTALALASRGWSVRVHERADGLDPVGAGIQLSPNALDVLDRLGVAIGSVGVAADSVVLRDGPSGRRIATVPVESSDGRGYRVLHRADLQRVLLDAVRSAPGIAMHLGRTFASLGDGSSGIRAVFETAAGPVHDEADLLIAADGVRSAVASHFRLQPPRPSGAVALRYSSTADPGESPSAAIEAWLGARRHAVRYRIDEAGRENIVIIVPESDPTLGPVLGWDPRLAASIERARPLGSWPLSTVEPRWRAPGHRPVAFVGDAAHAMLPYAAQGAAMAIEDAFVLAACLGASPSRAKALARYEALRAPRLGKVLQRVAFHRRVYHLPRPLSLARDAALALRSPASLRRDLAWLYDWRAEDGASISEI
ncbi:FAD-dependent oxidoreductase [Aureimonas sp. SK2]|uniref:FAD-dependent oxidoreductase n=1 Tax=Aureimonas sp. SK2 TaxID=3015992 RepID=UPI0024445CD8|nr:FAD-dependent oxidoreductase [Aureimonas sp. SK2]